MGGTSKEELNLGSERYLGEERTTLNDPELLQLYARDFLLRPHRIQRLQIPRRINFTFGSIRKDNYTYYMCASVHKSYRKVNRCPKVLT